jgi:hypothetical protein
VGIDDTWEKFSFKRQFLLTAMLTAGVVILALSLRFDLEHPKWWESLSFVPNILAGLTGFLLGVPVALVALATIASEREEMIIMERVNRLTLTAWNDFRQAVMACCSEEVTNALTYKAPQVQVTHDSIVRSLRTYMTIRTEEAHEELVPLLEAKAGELADKHQIVSDSLPQEEELIASWSGILAAWATLDSDVRLQRMERGLAWFKQDYYYALRNQLARITNPLAEFANLHYFHVFYYTSTERSMAKIPAHVTLLSGMPRDVLLTFLERDDSLVNANFGNYMARALEAAYILQELRETVQKVIAQDWPACATEPTISK